MMMFLAQLGQGAGPKGGSYAQLIIPFGLMLGLMFVIVYFLMIKPQRKKEKERKEKLSRIGKDDKVVTSRGIHGKVVSIEENSLVICVDETKDEKIKINKNSIASIWSKNDDHILTGC